MSTVFTLQESCILYIANHFQDLKLNFGDWSDILLNKFLTLSIQHHCMNTELMAKISNEIDFSINLDFKNNKYVTNFTLQKIAGTIYLNCVDLLSSCA